MNLSLLELGWFDCVLVAAVLDEPVLVGTKLVDCFYESE